MAGRKKAFAWAPVRGLMKAQGADMVSRGAVDELIIVLEGVAKKIANTSLTLAGHAKRKKITVEDIRLAKSNLKL